MNPNFCNSSTISSSFSIFCSCVFSSFSPPACRNLSSSIARNFLVKARIFLRSSAEISDVSAAGVGAAGAAAGGAGAAAGTPSTCSPAAAFSFFFLLRVFFSSFASVGARPGTTRSRTGMPLLKPLVWGTPPSSSRLNAAGVSVPRA